MRKSDLLFLLLSGLFVVACRTNSSEDAIKIRLAAEPDKLNPLLTVLEQSTQICNKMFLPLMDYDATTLDLVPVLAAKTPTQTVIDTGAMAGTTAIDYEIRAEAVWDNNSPITGNDYVFSVKAIMNPNVANGQIKSYVEHIRDIKVDATNPKKFTVYANKYMLAENSCSSVPIMPAYAYDSLPLLKNTPLATFFTSDTNAIKTLAADASMIKFAEQFQSPAYTANPAKITGSGPYKLTEWVKGQRIVLSKKTKWWGDALVSSNAIFAAVPQKIIYSIIPDVATALNMLKGGQLDLVSKVPPAVFDELRNNDSTKTTLQYVTSSTPQIAIIGINGARPNLADLKVRRALAHLTDVDGIITNVMKGYAERVTGPFHSTKSYSRKDLLPIPFDIEKAKTILADAGWKDSDADGVLDKSIAGKKVSLKLTYIFASANIPGKSIALLLKESAAKAGIDIEVMPLESAVLLERLKKRDFDLYSANFGLDLADDDPKQIWHTSSNTASGGNRFAFGNTASDALIDKIRTTIAPAARLPLYNEFQQMVYDAQPCIFLFSPKERFVASTRFHLVPTLKRPGFTENAFVVK